MFKHLAKLKLGKDVVRCLVFYCLLVLIPTLPTTIGSWYKVRVAPSLEMEESAALFDRNVILALAGEETPATKFVEELIILNNIEYLLPTDEVLISEQMAYGLPKLYREKNFRHVLKREVFVATQPFVVRVVLSYGGSPQYVDSNFYQHRIPDIWWLNRIVVALFAAIIYALIHARIITFVIWLRNPLRYNFRYALPRDHSLGPLHLRILNQMGNNKTPLDWVEWLTQLRSMVEFEMRRSKPATSVPEVPPQPDGYDQCIGDRKLAILECQEICLAFEMYLQVTHGIQGEIQDSFQA